MHLVGIPPISTAGAFSPRSSEDHIVTGADLNVPQSLVKLSKRDMLGPVPPHHHVVLGIKLVRDDIPVQNPTEHTGGGIPLLQIENVLPPDLHHIDFEAGLVQMVYHLHAIESGPDI
jgi:hypothetical protein